MTVCAIHACDSASPSSRPTPCKPPGGRSHLSFVDSFDQAVVCFLSRSFALFFWSQLEITGNVVEGTPIWYGNERPGSLQEEGNVCTAAGSDI